MLFSQAFDETEVFKYFIFFIMQGDTWTEGTREGSEVGSCPTLAAVVLLLNWHENYIFTGEKK